MVDRAGGKWSHAKDPKDFATLMTICNSCGRPLDETVRYCSACGKPVPGWENNPTQTPPRGDPRPGEEIQPKADSALGKRSEQDGAQLLHDQAVNIVHGIVKAAATTRRWINNHGKFVVGTILSLVGLVFTIIGGSVYYERKKLEKYPPPAAIWIEGAVPEVVEGTKLRLTARTSPPQYIPDKFNWGPPEMIEGNGQQSVTLETKTTDRHTESYTVEVSLTAWDKFGNPYPAVKTVPIKIVPMRQWNHPPEWQERIHIEGSPEVRAGTAVSLDALAVDKDGDKLAYNWDVNTKSVQIEGNGNRSVTLRLPRNLTRSAFVLLRVKVTVTDGHDNGSVDDDVTLTVTRGGGATITRGKRKEASNSPSNANQQAPASAQPTKPGVGPLAVPQPSQNETKPK